MKKIILIIFTFISLISFSQGKKYTTYKVTDNETITSIAKKLGVTPYDILKLNPDAKNGINIDEVLIVPNSKYKLNAVKNTTVIDNSINYKDSIKDGILYHRVRFGETIYSLARKYKVKKKKVYKLNKIKKRSKISLGQLLMFPTKKGDTYTKFKVENVVVTESEFISYTVQADDTKYSLAKKHQISVNELERINPHLKSKTLNEYDVIMLPNPKASNNVQNVTTTTTSYKEHIVQNQETFYKITKLYRVTKEELIDLNPELVNGLKEGMILKIPSKANNVVFGNTNYKIHKVAARETMYKLCRLYDVTDDELTALNPILKDGLKEGLLLKIPSKAIVYENLLNLDTNFVGKKLEVVLMLPFNAREKANTSVASDKKLNRITDFYLGSVMAVNDLKKKGLSVHLKVLDTKGKDGKATVANLVNTTDFSNTDIIIGPMYFGNIKQVTKSLRNKKIPIISPVASDDHSVLHAKNVIQNTTKNEKQHKILDFIKRNYTNQNIVIIADEKDSKYNTTQIVNYLKLHDSINKVTVLRLEDGYIKKEKFKKNIKTKKENWVLLVSDDKATSSIAVDNLGVLSKNFKVTLFGLNKGSNFKNVKNSFLNRLSFHYPTNTFVDVNNVATANFNQNYKAKFGVEPSGFVYKGYDTTYDALLRIATYQNINDSFQAGRTKGVSCDFDYENSSNTSHLNKGVFIVKYKDYKVVRVE